MVARVTRRLPGFAFEARSPRLDETLPRMDIAVFVGFAASGPLQTPVALDDPGQFAAVFGDDAQLAWDPVAGRQVTAHLGATVRAFFRNGGRRCWVVRVAADSAISNRFPIPGMATVRLDEGVESLTPAFARARSEGSWSDPLRVGASLLSRPFEVVAISRPAGVRPLVVALDGKIGDVVAGDLVRLSFTGGDDGADLVAMLVVETVDVHPDTGALVVVGSREVWLRPAVATAGSATATGSARVFTRSSDGDAFDAEIVWPESSRDDTEVYLSAARDAAPPAGSVVRLSAGGATFVLTVADSGIGDSALFGRAVRLVGPAARVLAPSVADLPTSWPTAEVLTFELRATRGDAEATRLGDLGFDAPHPRYWGDAPTDETLYRLSSYGQPAGTIESGRVALAFEKLRDDLGGEAASRRFPLAGVASATAVSFPFGMAALPTSYLGRLRTTEHPLERDGLASFDAGLFLDPELVEPGTAALAADADFLRYTAPRPRELRGAHAALGIEEATIVAAPDAIHLGWSRAPVAPPPAAVPSPPLNAMDGHEIGRFSTCDVRVPDAPCLVAGDADSGGSFALEWSMCSPPSAPPADARFVLEQATLPGYADAVAIYTGPDTSHEVLGRAPGDYLFRVRLESGGATSDWSNSEAVRVAPATGFVLAPVESYSPAQTLAVQRALLRIAAARGDLFAVLSLPAHYREDDAISHVAALKSPTSAVVDVASRASLPLGADESSAFSHAAVYHPWPIVAEDGASVEARPPDGLATGTLAARALLRGAWIAPANEAMRGPVALAPSLGRDRRLDLVEAGVNVIAQGPRGFMATSADTLSDDDDLRPINVRRLLALLRRLALRLGARYVFEPNDGPFRRSVQRGFEAMLGQLFVRGAFAGATPQTSFQVVAGGSLATQQSVDQGRFVVELRVAPSLPMTFLTIRLVQTGDRTSVVETR